MMRLVSCIALLLAMALQAPAQRGPFIRASGEGVVSFKPDLMKLSVTVSNQADTAQQAADENATRSTAVIDAIKKLLGASADLRTVSYSVNPVYTYPSGGQPRLTGYQASNSLEVTTTDLSIAGRLIDTAVAAGANNIGGIRFGLKDPQPARQLALKLATQQARGAAEAIASGLNAKLGVIVSVEEASAVRAISGLAGGASAAVTTPVETGTVEVRANVVIEAELLQ
ncbi:MAG: SIMPL domain-containing protein [Bryobacterales bacterium]|nr:SIMPL domain-containing protein [Bryobacterales bacterium]